jgi:ribosomal protein S18 acetylase RimI-like enzyme
MLRVVIRDARADDVEAIASLFRRSFGTLTFLPTLHTPEEDRAFFAGVVASREVWVWEDDGRIDGFAALDGDELTQIYVEPEAHGRGIGSALLDEAKRRRPAGFELWVFQQNENARRFYAHRGFEVVRETDGSGNEERSPDALLAWRPGGLSRNATTSRRATPSHGAPSSAPSSPS